MSPAPRCLSTFLALATLLVAHGRAEACSCIGDTSPEAELEHADAVFVAKVASIQRQPRRQIVEMTVTRAFKGVTTGASITIRTGAGGGDCGIGFAAASTWLVYASRAGGLLYDDDPGYAGLHTIPCSRTTPLERAGADLAALAAATSGKTKTPAGPASSGAPKVPAAPTSEAPATSGPSQEAPSAAPPPPASTAPPATAVPPTLTPMPPTIPSAAPPPGAKGCACDAGAGAALGPFQAGLVALALLAPLARRRRR